MDQEGFEKNLQEAQLKSKQIGFSGNNKKPSFNLQKETLTQLDGPITKFIGYDHLGKHLQNSSSIQ